MNFVKGKVYHIYNRSNEKVFYSKENYLYFLRKVNKLVQPYCNILSWCLMPNHFHLLIQATNESTEMINEKHRQATQLLSKNIGTLLSSYSLAINKQEERKGSLWAHKTTAKIIDTEKYANQCFHYIHQNPVEAKLCEKMQDWEFSSFIDFIDKRQGKLAKKELAYEILNIEKGNFLVQSQIVLDEKNKRNFY